MAALVQPFPQQSAPATMLQARPSSSSGHYQSINSKHQRGSSVPLNMYASGGASSYRGQKMTTPVAPYAFTATPALAGTGNPLRQHPVPASVREDDHSQTSPKLGADDSFPALGSLPTVDTSDFFVDTDVANLDSGDSPETSQLASPDSNAATGNKAGPNRYRQPYKKLETQQIAGTTEPDSTSLLSATPHTSSKAYKRASKDDSELDDHRSGQQLKRYSRRSIATITSNAPEFQTVNRVQPAPPPPIRTYASVVSTPYIPERKEHRPFVASQSTRPSPGQRSGSEDSISSNVSTSRPASKREVGSLPSATGSSNANGFPSNRPEGKRPEGKRPEGQSISIPPRGSSDVQKRLNPSPLSRPFTGDSNSPTPKDTFASVVASGIARDNAPAGVRSPESPAAQQLAALNKRDPKKEAKPSRLRRAFSFGSAAELRKASAENNLNKEITASDRAKLHKEQFKTEEEAREAAIVQQQEASGLGAGIYSGQGNFFTGSTDNLSISSTASSASVMLRKMGQGVKRTSRSLVGLFRPKSVTGVAPADGPVPEPSVAQVSMVTVEAEREKVNVNLDPHAQVGGGTGFPKLERNSLDAAATNRGERSASVNSRQADVSRARVIGGERERAEVLAAVKKGILKRHGTDSANSSPRQRPVEIALPNVPRISDSPQSSAPSTPVDDSIGRGHRRTDSVAIEGEDYFVSVAKFAGPESRSGAGTPRSATQRNITFSPRIQFHDTWPSQEYDRRGDIATCNRLTPSLAQAIKEELNTFKMEMEVHESSKIYTHFF